MISVLEWFAVTDLVLLAVIVILGGVAVVVKIRTDRATRTQLAAEIAKVGDLARTEFALRRVQLESPETTGERNAATV